MGQTGGKARQRVVAGMGRYRRREGDQRKRRPTKRDIQGRSSFGERKPPVAMMNWAISATLVPARTFAKTKGRSPRIFFASRSITSRLAPTKGARSILLITSMSERVMQIGRAHV